MNDNELQTKLRIAGIVNDSITDGPGLRLSVFAQGCPHHCPGCHNPQTHDPADGRDITIQSVLELFDKNPLLCGVTLTGGEPFLQADAFAILAGAIQKRDKSVICYTGYTWEELLTDSHYLPLIRQCHLIIEGPFLSERRSLDLAFRGSSNQRIIHVQDSLTQGRAVETQQL